MSDLRHALAFLELIMRTPATLLQLQSSRRENAKNTKRAPGTADGKPAAPLDRDGAPVVVAHRRRAVRPRK